MFARLRKAKENVEGGFTLIELLVVMIIIGILAAVAIPVFLSQRAKAQDSATKADASTVGKEVATWYVDNATGPTVAQTPARRYEIGVLGNMVDIGKASENVTFVQGTFASPTTWCVEFNNTQGSAGNQTWSYSAANGLDNVAC